MTAPGTRASPGSLFDVVRLAQIAERGARLGEAEDAHVLERLQAPRVRLATLKPPNVLVIHTVQLMPQTLQATERIRDDGRQRFGDLNRTEASEYERELAGS